MKSIKFSHRYDKLPADATSTYLVGVSECRLEQLPDDFLAFDTAYPGGHYPLPVKGDFLVLTLFSAGHVWTTIRRWTPGKEIYYRSLIGQAITVEISHES